MMNCFYRGVSSHELSVQKTKYSCQLLVFPVGGKSNYYSKQHNKMDSVVVYPSNELLKATRALQFIQIQLLELAKDCDSAIQSGPVTTDYFLQLQNKLEKLLYETRTAWIPPPRKPSINDFTTVNFLGSGTFGTVSLVRHSDTRQEFAMKLIKRQNLTDIRHVQQVLVERDILTYTDHPFVVSMFCAFETERALCMVMEYAGGRDCASLLHRYTRLPLDLTCVYMAEIVCALEYIHSFGILHRDLKPSNLLISTSGHIKLTDFGLSKMGAVAMEADVHEGCQCLERTVNEFTDREISGTPLYIAPEVYLNLPYGKPVDWWALGIIVYQFLVGFPPFSGDDLEELRYHVVKSEVIWPRDEDALPSDAQNFITLLLLKNCVRRLGARGVREVKEHPFFHELDMDNLQRINLQSVLRQQMKDDTNCFRNQSKAFSDLSSDDDDNNDSSVFSAVHEFIEDDDDESSVDGEQSSVPLPYFCSVTYRFREAYSVPISSYSKLKSRLSRLYWRPEEDDDDDDDDDNDEEEGAYVEDSVDLMDQEDLEDQDDQENLEMKLCKDLVFLTFSSIEDEEEEEEEREETEEENIYI